MIIHVIQKNDSLYQLSQMYHVPVERLIEDNAIKNPQRLMIGQAIVIRKRNNRHVVSHGQSIYDIARLYHTDSARILALNPGLINPSYIQVGQDIRVPEPPNKLGTIEVNGYAYPNINKEVLNKTAPMLTYFSIFSYQINADGTLTPINDSPLISIANQNNTASIMVLTNINSEGDFDTELVHTVLNSPELRSDIINQTIQTMKQKGYDGVAIDFEYIRQVDVEKYNSFLSEFAEKIKSEGFTISTAVAPKTSSDQKGLLYTAHDYPVHGRLMDHVVLMTYEWGYTYGPAQPVAPYNKVEEVVKYAVSVIPNKKILLGIPNYGYDWTLPFQKGSAAKTLSNTEAIDLASEVGAEIEFDNKAKTPFFRYYDKDKKEHIVWFEDARSIEAKLQLVDKYNLGGISFWTLTNYFPQAWLVLNSMFHTKKIELKK